MTILQVCAYAAPYEGNFIRSLKALACALEAKNHNMVFAFPESAKEISWVKELGNSFDVHFLPLAKARILPETYSKLRRIYKKYPDLAIIHSHFELYDVPVALTAPREVKVFWHLHDALENYNGFKQKAIHKIQYGLLHRDARLLSVSVKHMQYVLNCGFPQEQAMFVPNGIDTERIRLACIPPDKRQYDFLIFGWEFERKGVDLCIEAMRSEALDCSVAVVGTEDTARIIRERYGEVKGLTVINPVADISSLYESTRCFLHISRAEGLSYALLEAIYAGLPVICSDIPENRFAERFPTVEIVPANSLPDIGSAMKAMLHQRECPHEKVSASRQIIEREYSVLCWVNRIVGEYGL